jgi:Fur family ferric uptake transcriptional regulator
MQDKPLRMTRQRQAILEALRSLETHPTAQEVHDQVRRRLPHVSLATVYRNLETLSAHGLIGKLELAFPQRRYDGEVGKHYHVCCIRCGRVDDVPISPVAHLEEAVGRISGYNVVGHRLEFEGVCPRCRGLEEAQAKNSCGGESAKRMT